MIGPGAAKIARREVNDSEVKVKAAFPHPSAGPAIRLILRTCNSDKDRKASKVP
jgi:hypothetical protein